MKKLRFVAFMMGAVLMSAGFTACSDDDDVIDILVDGEITKEVKVGEEISFKFTVVSDKKIDKIRYLVNSDQFQIEENIKETTFSRTFSYTSKETGILNFSIEVTDSKGKIQPRLFQVEVIAAATPLSEVKEIVLTYKGANSTENTSDILGLKYVSNVDGNTAKFSIFSTENKFAFLTEEVANAITSKEELIAAYDASTEKDNQFTAKSDVNFKKIWLISKVGDEYVWIEFKKLAFAEGNNKATFDYKK